MPEEEGTQLIVEEILKEASDESARIIASAKAEAKKSLDATRSKAKGEEDRVISEAKARGELVYNEVFAEGRMRAKRETIQKKEEILNVVLKSAEGKLQRYSLSKRYNVVELAVEACKKLDSENMVIHANEKDLVKLRKSGGKIAKAVAPYGVVEISFGDPLETVGGVRVSTSDGKIEIDDTFEGKLRRKMDDLRVKAAGVLFGGS